jgi:membrane-associated protease RseP (regulator of RpoE activity)
MDLVVDNCYVLDVFPLMTCVPLDNVNYIPLLDVTLIIWCMLWGMCHMLAKRYVIVPLRRFVCMFFFFFKKKGRHNTSYCRKGCV